MTAESHFKGVERIETFPKIGRNIRKGLPKELSVSDAARIREAIRLERKDLLEGYLSIVRSNSDGMVVIYTELIFALISVTARNVPSVDLSGILQSSLDLWRSSMVESRELQGGPECESFIRTFRPDKINPEMVKEFRESLMAGKPNPAFDLIGIFAGDFANLQNKLAQNRFDEALPAFDEFFNKARLSHDLLVELFSTLASVVNERCGQTAFEKTFRETFTSCLTYEGLWQAVRTMTPEEIAAFLADHLRGHFSGQARDGATHIIEEADRYRLQFEPCGSGGAMRRRALESKVVNAASPLASASPHTWSKKAEVPAYCTHCAVNELESIERFGYPILVTEFNADPLQPCGWTVFKDPKLIPDEFFSRLGHTKDPARFKKE